MPQTSSGPPAAPPRGERSARRAALGPALRIAGIYAAVSVAWILLSDSVAESLAPDPATLVWIQNLKGTFFVLASAGLIGLLVYRHSARAEVARQRTAGRETYFRELFESAPTGYQSLDAGGRLLDVNQAWCDLLGHAREEVLGRPMAEFLAPSQLPLLEERFPRFVAEGKLTDAEFVLRRRDGGEVVVTIDGRLQRDADGRMVRTHCVLHDITERKQAEQDLRRSRERLALALEGGQLGSYTWDLRTGTIVWDERHAELFGVALADFAGTYAAFRERVHPADLPRVEAAVERSRRDRSLYDCEFRARDASGGWRWIAARGRFAYDPQTGEALRMSGVVADIDDRKRTEADLELRSRAIENSLNGFDVVGADGRFVYVNQAYLRMWGYDDLADVQRTVPADHCADPLIPARIIAALEADGEVELEFTARRKDGSTFEAWMVAQRTTDSEGRPLYMGTSIDISDRKNLEAQLLQAQKMEAVGQLAGGVAHDFNNLLQVINGYAEMALEGLPEHDPAHPCVREVVQAGGRAARLVAQLLAFSRRQVIDPADLDLNDVVAGMLDLVRRSLGERIAVEWLPGHQLGTVRADRVQVEQVLMNLCINARDAMPEGGRLTIETENVRLDGEYCRHETWAQPGRYVLLSVTDSGLGMSEAVLQHIWEPFFTTKEPGKGTGLGLSTVYGIVRQHDGLVHVYSEPDQGTTVKIYLPLVERPATAVGTKLRPRTAGGHETILVAEDNDHVRELMCTVLERAGYSVLLADDGDEALALLEREGDGVDLAILDVVMPGLGGREVHDRVHDRLPGLKFLFASGYSLNGVHTDFVLDQGFARIQKPFAAADLLAEVRALLDADAGEATGSGGDPVGQT